jgi:hypothetical protein
MLVKTCNYANCNHPHYGRGWCKKHWARARANGGDPTPDGRWGEVQRFLERVVTNNQGGCIEWPFSKGNHGYGRIGVGGYKDDLAHRVVCLRVHGEQPEGTECAHLCGNRSCVNPAHLIWVTHAENEAHKVDHDTAVRGEDSPKAKLTERQVRAIRKDRRSLKEIANQYSISTATASQVRNRKRWSWLPN